MGLAQANLRDAQTKQKTWYDQNARNREFIPGQQVLVLKPTQQNKLITAWASPFTVLRRMNECNYFVQLDQETGKHRAYHINMLEEYFQSAVLVLAICSPPMENPVIPALPDLQGEARQGDTIEQVGIGPTARRTPAGAGKSHIGQYQDLFTYKPGRTHITDHPVNTEDQRPLHKNTYRVSCRGEA
ncbi:hypothetical protein FKM82_028350 [Ascaphus truei]